MYEDTHLCVLPYTYVVAHAYADQVTAARPRDAARTRERILASARQEFASSGFGAATVHAIAARAEVSPNLITRYFGGKEGLFAAASEVRLGVDAMFDGPRASLGERMAATIVGRWVQVGAEDPLVALLRASGEHRAAAGMLADVLDHESLAPLQRQLEHYGLTREDASARARAIDVFLLGVTTRLRILDGGIDDVDGLRTWMGETIQRLVDAE